MTTKYEEISTKKVNVTGFAGLHGFTLTAWENEEALRLATHSGAHSEAMHAFRADDLSGGVFTSDVAKGMRVLQKLRAGITWLNTYHPTFNEAPWGGYKQSGTGRELGTYGLEAYLETKQININLNPQRLGWYSRL